MKLFDANVLLDIATADPVWLAWSEKEFRAAAAQGPILINPIIYAELAPAFATAAATFGGTRFRYFVTDSAGSEMIFMMICWAFAPVCGGFPVSIS